VSPDLSRYVCLNCEKFFSEGSTAEKKTVFERITQTPETLAEKLVRETWIKEGSRVAKVYESTIIPDVFFGKKAEAISATLTKLTKLDNESCLRVNRADIQIKKLRERGLQSHLARIVGISRSTVTSIFSGARRATPPQAKLLSEEFERHQIAIDLWDLLYEVNEGESLVEFIKRRER
jgi:plasmid maintenance system antidote protein VapI